MERVAAIIGADVFVSVAESNGLSRLTRLVRRVGLGWVRFEGRITRDQSDVGRQMRQP